MEIPDHSEAKNPTEDVLMRRLAEGKMTKFPDGLEMEGISLQERLFREAWRGWEESLRMARRHRRLGEVAAKLCHSAEPEILVEKLPEDEQARLKVWKTRFLGQTEGFEEEGMDMGMFGLDG